MQYDLLLNSNTASTEVNADAYSARMTGNDSALHAAVESSLSEIYVEAQGLAKSYSSLFSRNVVHALKPLDFTLHKGEVVGLLGPNGAGKTTTLMMLLGLLTPTTGSITIFGAKPTSRHVKQRIGFLPEESYFHRFMTATETLNYYGRLFALPKPVRKERVAQLLKQVGLWEARKRKLSSYSKGMLRRVGLAQALINDPDLLILDEPTSGLDPVATHQVKNLIIDLKNQGKTILLCSHLLADAEQVCDRILMLAGGEVLASGKLAAVLAQDDRLIAEFANPDDEFEQGFLRQNLVEFARHNQLTLHSMRPATQTLEAFFVNTLEKRTASAS